VVAALEPIAIFAGVSATVFLAFLAVWNSIEQRATAKVMSLADRLDLAGISMKPQEIVLSILSGVVLVWITFVLLLHPALVPSLLLLPAIAAAAWMTFYAYIGMRIGKRQRLFVEQLEPSTRLIGGGLRVGLGVRQALSLVIEELPDPARHEFRRVIGQANLGASVLDALDDMAVRMASHEALMMARVFRVQSESGGDLARILDQLADTIKDRRHIHRKIGALTAEGRMSAWVLMLIPVGLGLFIAVTQPAMANALFYTWIGHIVLLIILGLELGAFVWLRALLRVRV
jgi:tight adherence protein B